ncbi:Stalked cell differentiation-controlling protein [Bhargavaea cecembensis DSE10]|uniref:Stalked cell differentiation-controlling protein n=1 Tax=Bhargavaea cecembensis DSE10 TaxID=1235279 RepID=M7ND72_9BACL|nr:sensor domain-containing diguanylate cyclase [Bhargavaea cecembensis]EMR05197.1 Stalked cell differentiation-controlling protein [Bhargavaea cecembensis DSE10]
MRIGKGERVSLPLVWLLLVPGGMAMLWQLGRGVDDWIAYTIMAAAAVVTGLFPLEFRNITVSFQQWLLIAIFLRFGAGAEALASQLVVLASVLFTKSALPPVHRFVINSLIFFFSSVFAAGVFFLAGGVTGSMSVPHIIGFGLLYMMAHLAANHLCMLADSKLFGRPYHFRSRETVWDAASLLVIFPFGIAAYFLERSYGPGGLFPILIPFFIALLFAARYNTSEGVNRRLRSASKTGYELAGRLNSEELIRLFIHRIRQSQGADIVYLVDSAEGRLLATSAWEEDALTENPRHLLITESAGSYLDRVEASVFGTAREWQRELPFGLPEGIESVMVAPLLNEDQLTGYVVAGAYRRHLFAREDVQIFDLLCTHFTVSLEKARYVETAASHSERCPLTGMHNYRWLESELERRVSNVNGGVLSRLSLIILDIDHFKRLNDTYGHQSGNDILVSLAAILEKETEGKGHAARFGGEEFVILLPGWWKEEAVGFAERLRKYIEHSVFEIRPDLGDERTKEFVSITASFGVASVPEDTDEPMDLLRNADRALYVGGKQSGRNKVGVYQV